MVSNTFKSRRTLTEGFGSRPQEPEKRDVNDSRAGASAKPASPILAPSPSSAPLPHEAIAKVAAEIWRRKGCPEGRDEENWREAEQQLRAESQH